MTVRSAFAVFMATILLIAVAAKESGAPKHVSDGAVAPPPSTEPAAATDAVETPAAPEASAAAPPSGERSRSDRPSRGRRSIESLTPAEIDEIIVVAGEISPEWGESLRSRQASDPEGLRAAIAGAGPRLVSLAVLKRSHPDLYRIRVEDLRIQNELKTLAQDYRLSLEKGDARAPQLEAELRRKVERQVDLDLRASAMELQALDEQVKKMVDQLKTEAQQRGARIDQVLEEIKAGGEPKPMVRPWRSGGDRSGRGPRPSGGSSN